MVSPFFIQNLSKEVFRMSLENFSIIKSTLREGEQFVNAFFTTEQKIDHCPDAG